MEAVVSHGLDLDEGALIVAVFKQIPLEVTSSKGLLNESLRLAVQYKRSVYDCLFLSLSIQTGNDLITADEKFYQTVKSSFSNLIWIGDYDAI